MNTERQPLMDAEDMCRICLEQDKPENMRCPCKCAGTNKYIHEECLVQCLITDPEKCRTCHHAYSYEKRSVNILLGFMANWPVLGIAFDFVLIVGLNYGLIQFEPNKLDKVIELWNIDAGRTAQYFIVSEIIIVAALHLWLIVVRMFVETAHMLMLYTAINLIAFMFFNVLNIIVVRAIDNELYGSTVVFTLIMLIPVHYGFKQCYDKLSAWSRRILDYCEPV